MNKIKQFFQRSWHWIFILICILIIGITGYSEYQAKIEQQHVDCEVSSGKIPKQQLHQNGVLFLCYHRVVKNQLFSDKFALAVSNNDQLHEYSVPVSELDSQIRYLKKYGVRIISMQKAIQLIKADKP